MPKKEIVSIEEAAKSEAIAQRMAERAGENTRTYTLMPTVTVYNSSKSADESPFVIGDLVKGTKTQQGWETEKYEKPFSGIIIKTRMFLKLKFKYAEGKPNVVTNEFDSYSDQEQIIAKKQDENGMYQPEFVGNYKQVNEKYSLKSDTEIEKKLDLHHAIYVLRDLDSGEIIRIDSKGLSRSNYFDYMNSFSRKGLDRMATTWTKFNTEISETDFRGKQRQIPIAAITFEKEKMLSVEELVKAEAIQVEFEKQLMERDRAFGNLSEEKAAEMPKSDLPTINLDEEESEAKLLPAEEEEEEVKIEDVPF